MTINKIQIVFSDLSHTGHFCNTVPYAVATIAAYAKENRGHLLEPNLFKDPIKLTKFLDTDTPQVMCFTNYIWNFNLSYQIARRVKAQNPDVVIVFGGPNYANEPEAQEAFLAEHPAIDFYIYRDGERPFVALLDALVEYGFDIERIKSEGPKIPSCHYMHGDECVRNDIISAIQELDDIPSPYIGGLLDEFLERQMTPMMKTARGCPFKCSFCQEGSSYFNKVRRYSYERVEAELEYIAQRTKDSSLLIVDSNFGMFKQDIVIANSISRVKEKYGWPKLFIGLSGKNQKERLIEAAKIIGGGDLTSGAVSMSAAVQSTDDAVLSNVDRSNIKFDQMLEIAEEGEQLGATTFSELILALPGCTKESHFKSVYDIMSCGVSVIRSHQYIMLPGSDGCSKAVRKQYEMETGFRVTPGTVKPYDLYGERFFAPEYDEICVGNSTLPFDDYVACREFDLTIEIFYNHGLFKEVVEFLRQHEISIPSYIDRIHAKVSAKDSPLAELYAEFTRETKELYASRADIENFLAKPGSIEKYQNGELGNNEQLMYRALAIFHHIATLHDIAFDVASSCCKENGILDDLTREYLNELKTFSLYRKRDLLTIDQVTIDTFNYDFVGLKNSNFSGMPAKYRLSKEKPIEFKHTPDQKDLIEGYVNSYGVSNYGLGNIMGGLSHVRYLYRDVSTVQ